MKTFREFMEDDDMDYMEAAEAAINTRPHEHCALTFYRV